MKTALAALWLVLFSLPAFAGGGTHWEPQGCHKFPLLKSWERSQGVTVDEHGTYWYSWQLGLLRAKNAFANASFFQLFAIPLDLFQKGLNHIGDIDVSGGKLYAGIEDGGKSGYRSPHVGVYDAHSLKLQYSYDLPTKQQIDGVPWIAVDAENHRVLSSIYSDATEIFFYDQTSFDPIGSLRMSLTIDSIQGGKVRDGVLYLSASSQSRAGHSVYAVDLSTGYAQELFELPADFLESEGLAIPPTRGGQGLKIQVLGIIPYRPLHLKQTELCDFSAQF